MRDCAELVKALREYAEWMGPNNYELPIAMYDHLLEAADAIEELSKLQASCQQVNWISVEERLPEEWWPVLALIRFSEEPPAQEVLWHIGNGKWRACWDGAMVESKVSHWMPLPALPKEDKHGG